MKNFFVKKSKLSGEIEKVPTSKSQTMRAILFASLASGKSIIKNFLKSDDIFSMIEGCEKFKAKILIKRNNLMIEGVNKKIVFKKNESLNVKNSGIALRFLSSIYSRCDRNILITGDRSIQTNRSMKSLLTALKEMGAQITYKNFEGFAPFEIKGPIKSKSIEIEGEDSQFVSSMLIALSLFNEKSEIIVKNPGEKPFVEMTLFWLKKMQSVIENENFERFKILKPIKPKNFEYEVPTDFSSILFLIVAALITGSEIILKNIVFDTLQKDFLVLDVLKDFKANIFVDNKLGLIKIKKSILKGRKILDVNDYIDSIPVLAVFGCFVDELILTNAKVARKKESNRLQSITQELKKMNADILETEDGLIIKKSKTLKAAVVNSHKDHRIAMALTVAALTIDEPTTIQDVECINKTYPGFKKDLNALGACVI
ncbi:MAG: 3-phosphoshikimate 1-carboxyvinyltransferase [Parachlamydiales bacterium]|nr:3-phosphoshikimate 1-carboxyvinyltransferase [Parachlamydiales bacterium]